VCAGKAVPAAGCPLVRPVGRPFQCPFLEQIQFFSGYPNPFFSGIFIMMKGQIAGLMRQAQQMQENMKKAQDALADIVVEGAAGGSLVKVSMTCRHDVKRVTIDPSLLADDKDMLEDLVAAAFNDALRKAEATAQEKMSSVTAGMPLPPGMKLPF
jgi:DNA-binding YbaB/EbfC family protein